MGFAFTKNGSNPIHSGTIYAADPHIIVEDGEYWMYYVELETDGDEVDRNKIYRAKSTDGVTWTDAQKVLDGNDGYFDERVETPHVIKSDGTYYMYYSGITDANEPTTYPYDIGLATSADGVTFSRYSTSPLFARGTDYYDDDQITSPNVIEVDGTYYMFYTGINWDNPPGDDPAGRYLMVATSENLTSWTKSGPIWKPSYNAVVGIDGWADEDIAECFVMHWRGRWWIFFTGIDSSGVYDIGFLDYAEDFGSYRIETSPVLSRAAGTWENLVIAPTVLIESDDIRIWYTGYDSGTGLPAVGVATGIMPRQLVVAT
jgi:predicted GH43/DUF377 family glycosyl hydrolase